MCASDHTYPQSLLAALWINCSPCGAGLYPRGFQRIVQKTIKLALQARKIPSKPEKSLPWRLIHTPFPAARKCPHSLLAPLWIRCSPSAGSHGFKGLRSFDQNLIICRLCTRFPQKAVVHSGCPQLLWVELWIKCWSGRRAPANAGFYRGWLNFDHWMSLHGPPDISVSSRKSWR